MSTDRPATDPAGTDQIAAALVAVQAAMPTVHKGKTATVPMKSGGSYSYKYADLSDVSAAILPLLVAHGIAWSCVPREGSRGYELAGTLLHTSGQSLSGALPLHGNDPQQLGSAITYARRYLLGCLTGIVTDDDTDAGPAKGASQTRGWDGPSTAALLNQIDADGQRAGVTYEQAVAKLMARAGVDIDGLEALDPWMVAPFAEAVKKHADKLEAEAAAADKAAAERAAAGAPSGETADPAAPDDPWGKPAT